MDKLPNELAIKETQSTVDMFNNRGSSRQLDVYQDGTELLVSFDLNAVSGSLEIKSNGMGHPVYLSPFQKEMLIRFLQQKD
jgi:hypothetical protein